MSSSTFSSAAVIQQSQQAVENSKNSSFLWRLPKVELHAHLNGSIRESTIIEFLKQHPKYAADDALLKQALKFCRVDEHETRTMEECFSLFNLIYELITDYSHIRRITLEMIEDYVAENCIHLEIRTTCKNFDSKNGVAELDGFRKYVDTVLSAIQEYHNSKSGNSSSTGSISIGIILCVNRTSSLYVKVYYGGVFDLIF